MKCPNCGDFVRAVDTLDSQWCYNRYYDSVEGACPTCGKMWRWTEVYTFAHVIDVQEINPNDHL